MCRLDFTQAFLQLLLDIRSRNKTAFQTPFGIFQFRSMPMGYKNATAQFQKRVDEALAGVEGVIAYIDDCLVYASTKKELWKKLHLVLERLSQHGFRLNHKKCEFGVEEVDFLGFRIDGEGVTQTDDRLSRIKDLPYPNNSDDLKSVMGVFTHLREFAGPKYASLASHLYKLTRKGCEFIWGDYEKELFDHIKGIILEDLKLIHPDWNLCV